MGESKTAYLTDHQLEVIERMVERGEAGNESEALRNLVNEGMVSFGYRGGQNGNTTLKWMAKELARAFTWAGLAWLAFFWAFPVGFRLPGVMVLIAALGMIAVYLVLDKYEPAVSHRLFGTGEKA
jgi:hypothetical protein